MHFFVKFRRRSSFSDFVLSENEESEEADVENSDEKDLQESDTEDEDIGDENLEDDIVEHEEATNIQLSDIQWGPVDQNFTPRKTIPVERKGLPTVDIDRSSTELDVFLKLFPRSLLIHIADCTNV